MHEKVRSVILCCKQQQPSIFRVYGGVGVDRIQSSTKFVIDMYVVASNTIGGICFTIVDQSKITTHPSNMTKREGENVTLHCNATGNPLPTLSWTKDGSDIANNHRISISEDKKQLAITIANREDRGGYLCVAHNEVGNDSLIIAILDVQCK